MRKLLKIGSAAAALALVLGGCAPVNEQSDPEGSIAIEIPMNSTNGPTEVVPYSGFDLFQKAVAELSDGEISIKYNGGPESIDPFEMGNVIGTGAIKASFAAIPYMLSRLPEGAVTTYSPLTSQEMRSSGAFEKLSKVFEDKMNVHLLGLTLGSVDYNFYSSTPIESIDDFKGMRMRSTPGYQPLLESLGVEGIQMPSGDIYSAMERNLIDAYPQLSVGSVYSFGTENFVKYKVGPGWWRGDLSILVDLDYWNSLSDAQRNILTEAAVLAEDRQVGVIDEMKAEEEEKLNADGITVTTLSDSDGKKLQSLAAEAGKAFVLESVKDKELADSLVASFFP